jgi:hypothetical protein
MGDTLDRAWQVLATLPRQQLTMLPTRTLDARYPAGPGGEVPPPSAAPGSGQPYPVGRP